MPNYDFSRRPDEVITKQQHSPGVTDDDKARIFFCDNHDILMWLVNKIDLKSVFYLVKYRAENEYCEPWYLIKYW